MSNIGDENPSELILQFESVGHVVERPRQFTEFSRGVDIGHPDTPLT